jgi:glutathione peroxidase
MSLARTLLDGPLKMGGRPARNTDDTAHAFQFAGIDGEPLPLSRFDGKAMLVVNTASRCGFTPQYEKLQQVWDQYRERGLVVVGVPCNDFASQEPGSEASILDFCQQRFNTDFPLTAKTRIVGRNAHPFYQWAGRQVGPLATPKWNFHKYLIAPDGRLVDWFSSTTSPTARRVLTAIERHLPFTA